MSKLTHIPKTVIGPDGKPRVVYARTPETDKDMEKFRLGSLAELEPLTRSQAPELFKSLKEPSLVIQAPYLLARQIVRTRLEMDRSIHRIANGMVLFQHHFFATDSSREGYPQFKQYFLFFGYYEQQNKLVSQVIGETLFTRYELELPFWLLIPKTLGEMAAQWGDAFMNFQMFPYMRMDSIDSSEFTPQSVACITNSPSTTKKYSNKIVTDPSFKESGSPGDFDDITQGDVKFAPKKKKNWGGF